MEPKDTPRNRTKKTTKSNMDPLEFKLVDDPKGLKLPLMPHQKKGLTWLLWRETQEPSGGLLADDMGLGKTLTMISLVVKSKEINIDNKNNNNNNTESVNAPSRNISKRPPQRKTSSDKPSTSGTPTTQYPGGTLVICLASLIKQWSGEIKTKTKEGVLSTMIHHGPNRRKDPKELAQYDMVVTTYDIVRNENSRSGAVFGVQWRRVIVDEAHQIRNYTLRTSEAVCDILAKSRWALSGTPVHNTSDDMYAILKFLRYAPFDDLQVWRECVSEDNHKGKALLGKVLSAIVLRRTKVELIEEGDFENMPMKTLKSIPIYLDPEEMAVYKEFEENSKTHFRKCLHQNVDGSGTSNKSKTKKNGRGAALTNLLRLRQICCHPGLTKKDDDDFPLEDFNLSNDKPKTKEKTSRKANPRLTKQNNVPIEDMNLSNHNNKPKTKKATSGKTQKSSVFDFDYASSKIKVLTKMLKEDVPREDKAIVVSQFTSFLNLVAFHLDDAGITHTTLNGSVPVSKRSTIVDSFNGSTTNPKVLLLSLKAGGTGLNLVGANHLFMLDLHWNPQLENQAQDRIYRIGQTKPVFVYKFITRGTIEERIQALQQKKLKTADEVMKLSQLNLQELKMLYNCK